MFSALSWNAACQKPHETTRTEIKSFVFSSHFIFSPFYPVYFFILVFSIHFLSLSLFSASPKCPPGFSSAGKEISTLRTVYTRNFVFSHLFRIEWKSIEFEAKTNDKRLEKIRRKLRFRCASFATPPSSWDRRVAKRKKDARCQRIQPISIHLPGSIIVYWARRQRHTVELERKKNTSKQNK